MRINNILEYNNILIQCHNNPDADTIASGFAIQQYLAMHNKQAEIVYGGHSRIQKSSLLLMLESLNIKLNYLGDYDRAKEIDLLITVDCQPGESNVDNIECNHLVIIDHHLPSEHLSYIENKIIFKQIDPNYASCSSLIYNLLINENFEVQKDSTLATALYYGLYTDSNKFSSPISVGDENMRMNIQYDKKMIRRFQGSNISQADFEIALKALSTYRHNNKYYYAVSEAQYCDPNILGLTSDILIEVNIIDICIVYCIRDDHIKMSVRSCIEEVQANSLCEYIASQIQDSDGGGTETKAGGKISIPGFKASKYYRYELNKDIAEFMYNSISDYFENSGGR